MQAPPSAMGMPQQRQPGLMAQMAATAGGVAIGSAVVSVLLIFLLNTTEASEGKAKTDLEV